MMGRYNVFIYSILKALIIIEQDDVGIDSLQGDRR